METKVTKQDFEKYLNSISPEQGSSTWIINGKIRMSEMWLNAWGTALRKFDPASFQRAYIAYNRKP